ncbi:MAG: hypothetical protein K0U64_09985 [Actinomycetia bacterium]|nr:hypothetical protein [Actinomycetes bacterium]
MGIERFLKQSDGFEVDEPVDPVPIPPVGPTGSNRFGLPGKTTSAPLITGLPNVPGLAELVRALTAREAALRGTDQTGAAAAATDAAQSALERISNYLAADDVSGLPD